VVARDVCPHRGVPLTLGFHDEKGSFVPITACASGRMAAATAFPPAPIVRCRRSLISPATRSKSATG
jgi:hypothetical protein